MNNFRNVICGLTKVCNSRNFSIRTRPNTCYILLGSNKNIEYKLEKKRSVLGLISNKRFLSISNFKACSVQPPEKSEVLQSVQDALFNEKEVENNIIKLRGLSWTVTKKDIIDFFGEIEIKDVALAIDHFDRPSGIAYVELAERNSLEKALSYHNAYLGKRYVEVFQSSHNARSLEKFVNVKDCCMKFVGIPHEYSTEDVKSYLSGFKIAPDGITIQHGRSQQSSGLNIAYVQFEDEDSALEALKLDRQQIGDRYLRVFYCNLDTVIAAKNVKSEPFSDERNSSSNLRPGHFVRLVGMPFTAEEDDVRVFLDKLDPISVEFEMNVDNRRNGKALVEFSTHDEANRAMSYHKKYMRHRYVNVYLHSKED